MNSVSKQHSKINQFATSLISVAFIFTEIWVQRGARND